MRIVIILIVINFLSCFPIDKAYECISLGGNCTVAASLQAFGLRNATYPFDWLISTYESLCGVLENDFQDFLNPHFVHVHSDNRAIINKYGLIFTHDFPIIFYSGILEEGEDPASKDVVNPEWINILPEVQAKYERRIQRLRNICMSNKKVYFIRYGGIKSRDQACILRNILKTTYPNLDFILIVTGNTPLFCEQWEEPNIKNYYLESPKIWNDVAKWKDIFIDLGLTINENHSNRYFIDHKPIILNHLYCYLENGEAKGYPLYNTQLLALDKNHSEIRE